MDGKVARLDDQVARRLSAGQLVTGPAAVVKELLDNAIDAGATVVVVGVDKDFATLSVKDNGRGVPPRGRELLGSAHCTSKITAAEDVYRVSTLGFRGEAVHLIAEACELMDIVTKTADEAVGVKIALRAGASVGPPTPAAATTGTLVTVRNLFQRFPVRLKQLQKHAAQELGAVHRVLLAAALAHPQLKLMAQRPFLQKPPTRGARETVAQLFGRALEQQLVDVRGCSGGDDGRAWEAVAEASGSSVALSEDTAAAADVAIDGLWPRLPDGQHGASEKPGGGAGGGAGGSGSVWRSANDRLFVFVNGRAAQLSFLERRALQLCRAAAVPQGALEGKFPLAVLRVRVRRDWVDANVSPDKSELLLGEVAQAAIIAALERALEPVLATAATAAAAAAAAAAGPAADARAVSGPPATEARASVSPLGGGGSEVNGGAGPAAHGTMAHATGAASAGPPAHGTMAHATGAASSTACAGDARAPAGGPPPSVPPPSVPAAAGAGGDGLDDRAASARPSAVAAPAVRLGAGSYPGVGRWLTGGGGGAAGGVGAAASAHVLPLPGAPSPAASLTAPAAAATSKRNSGAPAVPPAAKRTRPAAFSAGAAAGSSSAEAARSRAAAAPSCHFDVAECAAAFAGGSRATAAPCSDAAVGVGVLHEGWVIVATPAEQGADPPTVHALCHWRADEAALWEGLRANAQLPACALDAPIEVADEADGESAARVGGGGGGGGPKPAVLTAPLRATLRRVFAPHQPASGPQAQALAACREAFARNGFVLRWAYRESHALPGGGGGEAGAVELTHVPADTRVTISDFAELVRAASQCLQAAAEAAAAPGGGPAEVLRPPARPARVDAALREEAERLACAREDSWRPPRALALEWARTLPTAEAAKAVGVTPWPELRCLHGRPISAHLQFAPWEEVAAAAAAAAPEGSEAKDIGDAYEEQVDVEGCEMGDAEWA